MGAFGFLARGLDTRFFFCFSASDSLKLCATLTSLPALARFLSCVVRTLRAGEGGEGRKGEDVENDAH